MTKKYCKFKGKIPYCTNKIAKINYIDMVDNEDKTFDIVVKNYEGEIYKNGYLFKIYEDNTIFRYTKVNPALGFNLDRSGMIILCPS